MNAIKIGSYTNIQDGAIIHVAKHNVSGKARPTLIGGAQPCQVCSLPCC